MIEKSHLHFMTCGSVDDGKSTLIGRLLYETHSICHDHLQEMEQQASELTQTALSKSESIRDSVNFDLAGIVDGLAAEKEQGITIDIAYRYFSTKHRNFVIADCPGHEQYTRNMATAASKAELAIVLIDATKGILTQTQRHSYIVSMLGIKNIVLAINKMDLVFWSQDVFNRICQAYATFALQCDFKQICYVPLSALHGDNIMKLSSHTPWYKGKTLLNFLESVSIIDTDYKNPLRMPIQSVDRTTKKRGYLGQIVSGSLKIGDKVRIIPSQQETTIEKIFLYTHNYQIAQAGHSITCQFTDHVDVSRGDMLIQADDKSCQIADQFQVHLLWMNTNASFVGRDYIFKAQTNQALASITKLKYKINVNTFEHVATTQLKMNDIGVANIALNKMIGFDAYHENKQTGHFILIDKITHDTVAMGLINFGLQRSQNISWQALTIDKHARQKMKQQKTKILWFTGLSGSGKSTIANSVETHLYQNHYHTMLLDGDNIRYGLNRDLGFTDSDRIENIRRIAEVSKLMGEAGLIVLVSFISPFFSEREFARALFEKDEFIEIHIHAPLDIVKKRDPKGLYKKALSGGISNFTGIDSPYEAPENPDIFIDTTQMTVKQATDTIINYIFEPKQ